MFPSPLVVSKRAAMRVLLIEDDSATAQSIELMLKSESFNVYTTDLGEEGIDRARSTTTTLSYLTSICRICRASMYCASCASQR